MSMAQQMLNEKKARVQVMSKILSTKKEWEPEEIIMAYCAKTYVSKRKAKEYLEILETNGTAVTNDNGTMSHVAYLEVDNDAKVEV